MAAYYIMTNYGPMRITGLKKGSDDSLGEILKDAPQDMDTFSEVSKKYQDLLKRVEKVESNRTYELTITASGNVVGAVDAGGNFYALNQNVDVFKVGDDCKGTVKVSDQGSETGVKKLIVGDDFFGVLNLSGDESIKVVEVGRKNGGRIDASLTPNLERMSVGKYFNGNVNLSSSAVHL